VEPPNGSKVDVEASGASEIGVEASVRVDLSPVDFGLDRLSKPLLPPTFVLSMQTGFVGIAADHGSTPLQWG